MSNNTPFSAQAVQRGCGTRVAGGCYAECGLSPFGRPLEEFFVDPPIRVDLHALGITPRGIHLIEQNGVWHVADWIGSQHYPNVADFIEEGRRFGFSRRCEGIDYSRLTERSKMVLLHARAWIDNADEYLNYFCRVRPVPGTEYDPCPCGRPDHQYKNNPEMCAGVWWNDVEGGDETGDGRAVTRKMPSFTYDAFYRPAQVNPDYQTAIFLTLPITRLVVVKADDKSHKQKVAKVERTTLPVEEVTR
jgi:hypothetical protein